jgi:hypothetical protein
VNIVLKFVYKNIVRKTVSDIGEFIFCMMSSFLRGDKVKVVMTAALL